MPDNVIQLDDYREWVAGPVKCLRCSHEQTSVWLAGRLTSLECGACGMMTAVPNGLVYESEMTYQTCPECANWAFALNERGELHCLLCGANLEVCETPAS